MRWLSGILFVWSAAAQAASNAPFLWQVQGPQATHYLMGSMHLLPPSAYPLPPALSDAYRAAAGVVVETDIGALDSPDMQQTLLEAGINADPDALRTQIGAQLYARLKSRIGALRMPETLCDAFKAWFCALQLELLPFLKAGFDPTLGIDRHFFERARAEGKKVAWLESPQTQLQVLTQMPEPLSREFLAAELDDATAEGQPPQEMLKIWRDGDLKALAGFVADMKSRYPRAYARLFADRNRAWLPKLDALLSGPDPQLVIVGAAHFAGPDGLLEALQRKGYKPRPVITAPKIPL